MKKESPVTFEIRIEGYKNHTWQGKVVTADGTATAFRSDLELLLTIDRLLHNKAKENVCQWNTCHDRKA